MSANNYGPETRAILQRLDALVYMQAGGVQEEIVKSHGGFHVHKVQPKAAIFTDTAFDVEGFNLVQISSDGNLMDVTYRIQGKEGSIEPVGVYAGLNPHIIGFNKQIYLTNATAESGKNVYIDMFRAAPAYLAAIQHGTAQNIHFEPPEAAVAQIFEVNKANDTDYFAANITNSTGGPRKYTIQILQETGSVTNLLVDNSTNTDNVWNLNNATALTANCVYVFDVVMDTGNSFNVQHDTNTCDVYCSVTVSKNVDI